ncbi:helix-turn-helix transcriptional regulator [Sphingobacterium corticis]|uniref:Helix-turn-helix transcriptional regulator n=1 Tax=Sphingobacterium corticis TaxID=1812823 RepID=A0ABW5NMT2_9SPHI
MFKNLRAAIREKYTEDQFAAEALGMDKGNFSNFLKKTPEQIQKLRGGTIKKFEEAFPEYNIDWLFDRSPIKYKSDIEDFPYKDLPKSLKSSNTKSIGFLSDDELQMFDEEGNTKFYEISQGVYRMKVPLIPETAKAGYLSGFADAEYLEDQEYIVTTVSKFHKGSYRAFRVVGDSMDVDKRTTFVHGDIIIGREIRKDLWKSRFHTHKYPFYAFVTINDGIIFKELINHDVDNGVVKLHSLNEDRSTYPDFDINLADVAYIYNIVKREVEI